MKGNFQSNYDSHLSQQQCTFVLISEGQRKLQFNETKTPNSYVKQIRDEDFRISPDQWGLCTSRHEKRQIRRWSLPSPWHLRHQQHLSRICHSSDRRNAATFSQMTTDRPREAEWRYICAGFSWIPESFVEFASPSGYLYFKTVQDHFDLPIKVFQWTLGCFEALLWAKPTFWMRHWSFHGFWWRHQSCRESAVQDQPSHKPDHLLSSKTFWESGTKPGILR